jgi:hypothetical protein
MHARHKGCQQRRGLGNHMELRDAWCSPGRQKDNKSGSKKTRSFEMPAAVNIVAADGEIQVSRYSG